MSCKESSFHEENKATSRSRQIQKCRNCRIHGIEQPLKDHKLVCPFRNCACEKCELLATARSASKQNVRLYREVETRKRLQADGIDIPAEVPSPIYHISEKKKCDHISSNVYLQSQEILKINNQDDVKMEASNGSFSVQSQLTDVDLSVFKIESKKPQTPIDLNLESSSVNVITVKSSSDGSAQTSDTLLNSSLVPQISTTLNSLSETEVTSSSSHCSSRDSHLSLTSDITSSSDMSVLPVMTSNSPPAKAVIIPPLVKLCSASPPLIDNSTVDSDLSEIINTKVPVSDISTEPSVLKIVNPSNNQFSSKDTSKFKPGLASSADQMSMLNLQQNPVINTLQPIPNSNIHVASSENIPVVSLPIVSDSNMKTEIQNAPANVQLQIALVASNGLFQSSNCTSGANKPKGMWEMLPTTKSLMNDDISLETILLDMLHFFQQRCPLCGIIFEFFQKDVLLEHYLVHKHQHNISLDEILKRNHSISHRENSNLSSENVQCVGNGNSGEIPLQYIPVVNNYDIHLNHLKESSKKIIINNGHQELHMAHMAPLSYSELHHKLQINKSCENYESPSVMTPYEGPFYAILDPELDVSALASTAVPPEHTVTRTQPRSNMHQVKKVRSDKRFSCKFCSRKFRLGLNLSVHYCRVHNQKLFYKCCLCGVKLPFGSDRFKLDYARHKHGECLASLTGPEVLVSNSEALSEYIENNDPEILDDDMKLNPVYDFELSV